MNQTDKIVKLPSLVAPERTKMLRNISSKFIILIVLIHLCSRPLTSCECRPIDQDTNLLPSAAWVPVKELQAAPTTNQFDTKKPADSNREPRLSDYQATLSGNIRHVNRKKPKRESEYATDQNPPPSAYYMFANQRSPKFTHSSNVSSIRCRLLISKGFGEGCGQPTDENEDNSPASASDDQMEFVLKSMKSHLEVAPSQYHTKESEQPDGVDEELSEPQIDGYHSPTKDQSEIINRQSGGDDFGQGSDSFINKALLEPKKSPSMVDPKSIIINLETDPTPSHHYDHGSHYYDSHGHHSHYYDSPMAHLHGSPMTHYHGSAMGHYHGSHGGHHGHYYQFAESHKKGQYDSGYKRGGKKFYISGHSSQHKNHAHGHVKWHGKGKGSHYWEYKHKDKKHYYPHGHHYP